MPDRRETADRRDREEFSSIAVFAIIEFRPRRGIPVTLAALEQPPKRG